jgi:hypothetical protein
MCERFSHSHLELWDRRGEMLIRMTVDQFSYCPPLTGLSCLEVSHYNGLWIGNQNFQCWPIRPSENRRHMSVNILFIQQANSKKLIEHE